MPLGVPARRGSGGEIGRRHVSPATAAAVVAFNIVASLSFFESCRKPTTATPVLVFWLLSLYCLLLLFSVRRGPEKPEEREELQVQNREFLQK